jgi:transposase
MFNKKKNGGKRPGSGRPPLKEEKLETISGTVPAKIKTRVEFEAKKRDITVSEYIREALKEKINFDQCLDDMDEKARHIQKDGE